MRMKCPDVKCPECVAEGKQSKVSVPLGAVIAVNVEKFHDKDGKYHWHDPNRTVVYKCSNDHQWTKIIGEDCWCGWDEKRRMPKG